jgi:signal transduction histidine kinase
MGSSDQTSKAEGAASSWLVALPPRAGAAVLLVLPAQEPARGPAPVSDRELLRALQARGHEVHACAPTEATARCEQGRFEVALLALPYEIAVPLGDLLRDRDPDLEVAIAPLSSLTLARALSLIQAARARALRRLGGLIAASRALFDPQPPAETAARFLSHVEETLGVSASLLPHDQDQAPDAEGPAQVLISPDRRRLRIPLWESGPSPDAHQGGGLGDDGGHRLEISREPDAPPLCAADVQRAALLATVGSLALVRAHCEQAVSELYRDLGDARAQLRRIQGQGLGMGQGGLTASVLGPLERLAGVLAHELNNPLTFVLANLACLRDSLDGLGAALRALVPPGPAAALLQQWEDMNEILNEAQGGADRVREVVSDLSTLGTRGEAEGRRPVALEDVVRAALRIAQREVQRRAQVHVDIAPNLPRVLGSASRLGQVILNLLLNAVQAVPPGEPAAHQVRVEARCEDRLVFIRISDTGTGIPPERLSRVFEPGYTTKPLGEGSGLGLAISREIVRTHGGDIHIDSAPGNGTTVSVVLPAYQPAQQGPRMDAEQRT